MSVSTHCHQDEYVAYNFSDAQVKVREATSNDPWGPSTALMSEIADLTHSPMAFTEIMSIAWKRLNDSGKNWRHVYKSLVLLDFLIKHGHEKVAQQCRENVFTIENLKDFHHVEDNRDQGLNIREKAKEITSLLSDNERLESERTRSILTRNKFKQNIPGPVGAKSRRSVTNSTLDPKLEEVRPSTATEEEMQLQIALALSHEEREKAGEMRKIEDARFKMALEKSQSLADRLASVEQELVSSDQLTQAALDDLLSLRVGEVVTGNSGHPSPSNAWNKMGTSESVVVSGNVLNGNTLSSTPEESQKLADRLASVERRLVSSDQLTQAALDDLLSLRVGEPVTGTSYMSWTDKVAICSEISDSVISEPLLNGVRRNGSTTKSMTDFAKRVVESCSSTIPRTTKDAICSGHSDSVISGAFLNGGERDGSTTKSMTDFTKSPPNTNTTSTLASSENVWHLDKREMEWVKNHAMFPKYLSTEEESNAFSKFVQNWKRTDHKKTLDNYTLEDACVFAAATRLWFNKAETTEALVEKKMDGSVPTFDGHLGICAFYQVMEHVPDQKKIVLTPCHAYVPAEHRCDLLYVEIDLRSVTRDFPFSPVNHLFPGDIVIVSKMARTSVSFNPTKPSSDIANCQWRVSRMTLYSRNIQHNQYMYFVKPIHKAFVEGCPIPCDVRIDRGYRDEFRIRKGSVFFPIEHRDKLEWAPKQDRGDARRLALKVVPPKFFSGVAYTCLRNTIATEAFNSGFEAFDGAKDDAEFNSCLKNVQWFIRLAEAAGYGTTARMLDRRSYKINKWNALTSSKISIQIAHNEWINKRRTWKKNIDVGIYDGFDFVYGVIDEVTASDKYLTLVVSLDYPLDDLDQSFLDRAFVKQRLERQQSLLDNNFLEELSKKSNGWKVIYALFGGPSISDTDVQPIRYEFPGNTPFVMDAHQSEYISKLLLNIPIVLGNSPFGSGKSTTIVMAAFEQLKKSRGRKRQLLITQSKEASVNLMEIARSFGNTMRPLYFTTEQNFNSQPANNKSCYDLTLLLEEVLHDILKSNESGEHAVIKNYFDSKHRSSFIRESAFGALLPIFLKHYNPNLITVTIDSLDHLLEFIKPEEFESVQVDEANQVPLVKLVKCLVRLPYSKFGFVGDVNQLPPFNSDLLSGGIMETYAFGSVMDMAIKKRMFPQSTFRFVYRSHPEITNLLSNVFYDIDLIPGVAENERNEFMQNMTEFWPNSKCPFLFIHNPGSDEERNESKINRSEMEIVGRLVELLKKKNHNGYRIKANDLGLVSLYTAQTEELASMMSHLKSVKVGNIDSYQGNEKQVVILATTASEKTSHLEFKPKTLVGLSRAKQCTVIVGNINVLEHCEKWRTIFEYARKNGNVLMHF